VKSQGEYANEYHFVGTGFFTGVSIEDADLEFCYLVTARHILEYAREEGNKDIYARLNTHDGGANYVLLDTDWVVRSNSAIDVAVLPFMPPLDRFRYAVLPEKMIATDHMIEHNYIGIGDELFVIGLFSYRHGHQRNIPIVRTGVIASMPDEPFIEDSGEGEGELYDAYLVEMRSIGGLSGSPVFVYLDKTRAYTYAASLEGQKDWVFFLIGLIRGHWSLEKKSAAIDSVEDEVERLNTGIAQITPAQEILNLLHSNPLLDWRMAIVKEERKKKAPTQALSN
jgi:hypothetical protein